MVVLTEAVIQKLWELYKGEGQDAVTLNHYELAERTQEHNPEIWKAFLMDPEVNNWVQSEMNIVKDTELKKMVKGAAKTKSVGQAQLMNAFSKLNENNGLKDGPVFIYTHVPLNNQQLHADNVKTLPVNPFLPQEEQNA